MNAAGLLQHFERISEAPNAIPRLRRFILDLAVRGKLVAQDPGDEPAFELLTRIQTEKARLVKAGEIRKERPLPLVKEDEAPYSLPTGWTWVRIRHVTSDRGQVTPDRDFTYIDVTAINKEVGCVADAKILSPLDAPSRARKMVRIGDVLYSCVRPYLLNIAVIEKDIVPSPIASTAFAVLNGFGLVLSKYLWIALRSPFMVECVEAKMRGQAYPAINDSDFAILPLPLPPLAEQHRIIAKVDELMALCDRLEEAQAERESQRDRVVAVSLNRLNNGADAESFREHARFHLRHLPRLTTRPEHIQEFRQTVLNLAVCGRLVLQDPNDEPASELLKRIQEVKARLVKEGVIKRHESPLAIAEDETPFQIPTGWEWSRFIEIAAIQSNLVNPHDYLESPHIAPDNIESGTGRLLPYETIEASTVFSAKHLFFAGCILYSKIRPALAKAVIVDFSGLCSADMYPILPLLNREYLHRYMLSEVFVKQSISEDTRVAMPKINQAALSKILVAVPPLTEQHRIVAKVKDLMGVCDLLEAQIGITAINSRQLLEATLRTVLSKVQGHASEVKRGHRASSTEVGNKLPRSTI